MQCQNLVIQAVTTSILDPMWKRWIRYFQMRALRSRIYTVHIRRSTLKNMTSHPHEFIISFQRFLFLFPSIVTRCLDFTNMVLRQSTNNWRCLKRNTLFQAPKSLRRHRHQSQPLPLNLSLLLTLQQPQHVSLDLNLDLNHLAPDLSLAHLDRDLRTHNPRHKTQTTHH